MKGSPASTKFTRNCWQYLMNSAAMQFQPALKTASLEPRATPTSEFTQLPPPVAESTTQAVTAQVFTYVTPPAPTNQSIDTVPNSNPKITPGIASGITLGICVVILVAALLIYHFNKRRSNKRAKAIQNSTSIPSALNPPMSEPPAQHMSSRQREKMPANNAVFQTAVDDEIRPVTPQKVFLASKKETKADEDSSSLVISPC